MDYEKEYKILVAKVKKAHQFAQTDSTKSVLEEIFPELRESEDERIRRTLVEYFGPEVQIDYVRGVPIQKIRDYLEKQKERKFDFELIKQAWYMEGYKDREFGKESKWIIKTGEGGPEYEENPKYGQMIKAEQKPATFNEPYNSDEYEAVEMGNATCLRRKEQKPVEWSEEDRNRLEEAIGMIEANGTWVRSDDGVKQVSDFLKALPERFNLQPKQEWSEEDEKNLKQCIEIVRGWEIDYDYANPHYSNWLKSLRPQPHWKPSEEQMNCLCAAVDAAIRKHNESVSGYEPARVLKSLYEDLKKL